MGITQFSQIYDVLKRAKKPLSLIDFREKLSAKSKREFITESEFSALKLELDRLVKRGILFKRVREMTPEYSFPVIRSESK